MKRLVAAAVLLAGSLLAVGCGGFADAQGRSTAVKNTLKSSGKSTGKGGERGPDR
jgi:hypothetical protein